MLDLASERWEWEKGSLELVLYSPRAQNMDTQSYFGTEGNAPMGISLEARTSGLHLGFWKGEILFNGCGKEESLPWIYEGPYRGRDKSCGRSSPSCLPLWSSSHPNSVGKDELGEGPWKQSSTLFRSRRINGKAFAHMPDPATEHWVDSSHCLVLSLSYSICERGTLSAHEGKN